LYQENHNAWLRGTDYGSEQCEACHESNAKKSGREDARQFGLNHPLGVKMHKPTKKEQHLSIDDPHLQKGLPEISTRRN
jgi:nitrate/TMAO reductase-like tetraheme cytochrome c subunit